jgi:hypothetical protein
LVVWVVHTTESDNVAHAGVGSGNREHSCRARLRRQVATLFLPERSRGIEAQDA